MARTIGVLALQGDFRAHRDVLAGLGVDTRLVRTAADAAGLDGIVLPGGESTAMARLAEGTGIGAAIAGLPTLATCAGLIMLADSVGAFPGPERFGGLAVTVERNGYGSQKNSFRADVLLSGRPIVADFIRAPRIVDVGATEVIARLGDEPVGVRDGRTIAVAFHTELGPDPSLHRMWLAGL